MNEDPLIPPQWPTPSELADTLRVVRLERARVAGEIAMLLTYQRTDGSIQALLEMVGAQQVRLWQLDALEQSLEVARDDNAAARQFLDPPPRAGLSVVTRRHGLQHRTGE